MLIFKKSQEQQLKSDIRRLKKEIREERAVASEYRNQFYTLKNELERATFMEYVNADTTKRDFLTGKPSKINYTPEEKEKIRQKNEEMQASRNKQIKDLKETGKNIKNHITGSLESIKSKTAELHKKEAALEKFTGHQPKAGEIKHKTKNK